MAVVRDFLRLIWTLFCLLCVAATVLALYDWGCDNLNGVPPGGAGGVRGRGRRCRPQVTLLMRTPITQSFELATGRRPRVHVRCARAWFLLGDYKCTALEPEPGALPPAPTPSAHVAPRPARSSGPGR